MCFHFGVLGTLSTLKLFKSSLDFGNNFPKAKKIKGVPIDFLFN